MCMTHLVRARGPNPCPFVSNVCTYLASVQAQSFVFKTAANSGRRETPIFFFGFQLNGPYGLTDIYLYVKKMYLVLSEWHVRIDCYLYMWSFRFEELLEFEMYSLRGLYASPLVVQIKRQYVSSDFRFKLVHCWLLVVWTLCDTSYCC